MNVGYNGSDRFAKNERFGFFPSAGLGWVVSNEKFMEPYQKFISKLKLKATYGLVGNDNIGEESDRFFYLSQVNMNDSGKGFTFGEDFNYAEWHIHFKICGFQHNMGSQQKNELRF